MQLFSTQKTYYNTGETKALSHRIEALDQLKQAIKANEANIIAALAADLHKSESEAYMTEIGILYMEIDFVKKQLSKWMKPHRVKTPITHFGSKSIIYSEPYGVTLIIAPWNYPFQLAIAPLIGAIAGGNCAILKPSELTPQTANVINKIISDTFSKSFIAVKQGAVETSQALLDLPFDYIFFTGSVPVGKIVMEKASKHLTPVTLELGGKSPVIVHDDASLKLAAKRIAWGKFINAGQTCIAPDYLYVHERVKQPFLDALQAAIASLYGDNPLESDNYSHIVNDQHFNRLTRFLDNGTLTVGGEINPTKRVIAPTVLTDITWEDPIMADEIFGPILPILTYDKLDEVIEHVRSQPKPLALYFFSETKALQDKVLDRLSFGGGCMNDTIFHIANPYLPFGGIGNSGVGAYHGKSSFDTFTHQKSVLKQTTKFDLSIRYPNAKNSLKWVKRLMK